MDLQTSAQGAALGAPMLFGQLRLYVHTLWRVEKSTAKAARASGLEQSEAHLGTQLSGRVQGGSRASEVPDAALGMVQI